MTTIRAPYNFVPLNDKVFYPDWADQVSHDIPFSDGVSGEIEYELEAMTPIYIRNTSSEKDVSGNRNENDRFNSFNGKYFIPGTSIKGMIRNVFEVLTYSKMAVDKRIKLAQRDWNNKELYTIKDPKNQVEIHCGWLGKNNEGYAIVDCGRPFRINHRKLDEFFFRKGIDPFFEKTFCETSNIKLQETQKIGNSFHDPKTSKFKYSLLGEAHLKFLQNFHFEIDEDESNKYADRRIKHVESSNRTGTIVFTGSPDLWKIERKGMKGAGKYYEFLFENQKPEIKNNISELEFEHFKYIYQDSEDWKYWSKNLQRGERIPVFFRYVNPQKKSKIKDFGFSMLYKLPYDKSVSQIVDQIQIIDDKKRETPDFTELVFGYTNKKNHLKGRVQFGHAYEISSTVRDLDLIKTTLGSPKPSFYPLYIRQDGRSETLASFKTYNDGVINGRKRYPLKSIIIENKAVSDSTASKFIPLDKGVKFRSKIRFHNLKVTELGALLSSITFHNHLELNHSIGMAKPLGYGQVKISSIKLESDSEIVAQFAMAKFEELMTQKIDHNWIQSNSIIELFAMANPKHGVKAELLTYMNLSLQKDGNEFELVKKGPRPRFKTFNELSVYKVLPKSLLSEYKLELEKIEQLRRKELEEKENQRIEALRNKEAELQAEKERIEREQRELKKNQLLSQCPDFLLTFNDYNKIKGRLEDYLRKTKQSMLQEECIPELKAAMIRCYECASLKEKKTWHEPFEKSHLWKKISIWISEDRAKELFQEINPTH